MQQTRSPYQIAMLQMNCDLFHVSNNLDKAEKQIREAAAHGAKLICLPEVFNVGYLGTCILSLKRVCPIIVLIMTPNIIARHITGNSTFGKNCL